jgi:hypothetical protein
MSGLKTIFAAALISAISATSVFAQAAISEPAAFQAQHPDRDVLNGGALTPAGGGTYAATNAYAGVSRGSPSVSARRYHGRRNSSR